MKKNEPLYVKLEIGRNKTYFFQLLPLSMVRSNYCHTNTHTRDRERILEEIGERVRRGEVRGERGQERGEEDSEER